MALTEFKSWQEVQFVTGTTAPPTGSTRYSVLLLVVFVTEYLCYIVSTGTPPFLLPPPHLTLKCCRLPADTNGKVVSVCIV